MIHTAPPAALHRFTHALLACVIACTLSRAAAACPACSAGRAESATIGALIGLLMLVPYALVFTVARAVRRRETAERETQ